MIRKRLSQLRKFARDAILLEPMLRGADAEQRVLNPWAERAWRRLRPARRLRGDGESAAALVFYREAVLHFSRALLFSVDSSAELGSLDAATILDRLAETLQKNGLISRPELARQRAVLLSADHEVIDGLSVDTANTAMDELEELAQWLASRPETRTPAELRAMRAIRVSIAVLGVVAMLALVAWALTRAPNLALGRAASASSIALSTSAAGAVDGIRYGQLGFHSTQENSAWLAIDLGREHVLSHVDAYGRGDCCFEQSVPLVFEVSRDGKKYKTVAKRTNVFTQYEPWIVPGEGIVARFVRFRTLKKAPLVLSEVEVYGDGI
jgi:F5/8 type C domain